MNKLRLFGWLAIAALPGWFGLQYLSEAQGFIARSVQADGQITRFEYVDAGLADHTNNDFRPWVRFEYVDGSMMDAPVNIGTSNNTDRIGDTMSIRYDPNFVSTVRLDSFLSLYFMPVILFGLAGFIAVTGCFLSRT